VDIICFAVIGMKAEEELFHFCTRNGDCFL